MNADKVIPEVEIELAGKTRRLVFNVAAACAIEEALGQSILSGAVFYNLGFRELRALLWGMMLTHQPSITLKEVSTLFTPADFKMVTDAVVAAFKKGMPAPKEVEGEEKKEVTP